MRRLFIALAVVGLLGGVMAAPVAATTTRIPTACEDWRQTDWAGGREWVDSDLVYHSLGGTATYRHVGDPYCAGTNTVTVNVTLDLLTGLGTVTGKVHIDLDAGGGWDGSLAAHFTPDGPYIWVGKAVGQGFGDIAGWQWRSELNEVSHDLILDDGFVFEPGS